MLKSIFLTKMLPWKMVRLPGTMMERPPSISTPSRSLASGQSKNGKNCAEDSKTLLERVPITAEVSVPFEFNRFIPAEVTEARVRVISNDVTVILADGKIN